MTATERDLLVVLAEMLLDEPDGRNAERNVQSYDRRRRRMARLRELLDRMKGATR